MIPRNNEAPKNEIFGELKRTVEKKNQKKIGLATEKQYR